MKSRLARYRIGQVVRHRHFPFRGVVFDIDPIFNNTEEWWRSIPEAVRPTKDQPFYHLLAENAELNTSLVPTDLLPDYSGEPSPSSCRALRLDGEALSARGPPDALISKRRARNPRAPDLMKPVRLRRRAPRRLLSNAARLGGFFVSSCSFSVALYHLGIDGRAA